MPAVYRWCETFGRAGNGQMITHEICLPSARVNDLRLSSCVLLLVTSVLTACATKGPYRIDLMPAPDVYDDGAVDPFVDGNPIEDLPYGGVLFATDREPADEEHGEDYYQNKRGHVLRLGAARVELGPNGLSWEEARKISLAKNRTDEYPLRVRGVTEFGVLESTVPWSFVEPSEVPPELLDGDEEFRHHVPVDAPEPLVGVHRAGPTCVDVVVEDVLEELHDGLAVSLDGFGRARVFSKPVECGGQVVAVPEVRVESHGPRDVSLHN